MDEIVKEFLVESNENLDKLDQDFVALEKTPNDLELISSIFRVIHTIKGACGFLSFHHLEKVAHAGENLLSKLRNGSLVITPEITTALLGMVDAVRTMLVKIEETKQDGEDDYLELLELLEELTKDKKTDGVAIKAENINEKEKVPEENILNNQPLPVEELKEDMQNKSSTKEPNKKVERVTDSSVRVDVSLLDKLMNLVGELVLSRNQIVQHLNQQNNPTFSTTFQRLSHITTELQENVMKTRMQPIFNVCNKFPRVVRDLAFSLGKQVDISLEGMDTEIDKSIIETIRDPLTHLVRNSVDHGIELPEVRTALGKSPAGHMLLKAYHESGMVNIEIIDDGAGINVEKVKNKALERGLVSQEQLSRLPDNDVIKMIFLPGFSTADKVSNISGRGVGMDVVKTNIEKIGGIIDIQSTFQKGTDIKIKIPLTLAIIPALMVTCANEQYAIPQVSLIELVSLNETQMKKNIENIQGISIYRLRGNIVPLIYLKEELGIHQENQKLKSLTIVVLQANNCRFGLVVDSVHDTQEIVVKPLGKLLRHLSCYAGATIMGDGRIALILDAAGLAQKAHIVSDQKEIHPLEEPAKKGSKETLLLFSLNKRGIIAVPLFLVTRLEEFSKKEMEFAGDKIVVQYRGEIMPLICLKQTLEGKECKLEQSIQDNQPVQVIVYTYLNQHKVGLIVEKVVDIVEEYVDLDSKLSREGIVGATVVREKVTEVIDIQQIISSALFQNDLTS